MVLELKRHRYLKRRKDAKRYAMVEYWRRCPKRRGKYETQGRRFNERTGEWEDA